MEVGGVLRGELVRKSWDELRFALKVMQVPVKEIKAIRFNLVKRGQAVVFEPGGKVVGMLKRR
jgi:hypothetical protein